MNIESCFTRLQNLFIDIDKYVELQTSAEARREQVLQIVYNIIQEIPEKYVNNTYELPGLLYASHQRFSEIPGNFVFKECVIRVLRDSISSVIEHIAFCIPARLKNLSV